MGVLGIANSGRQNGLAWLIWIFAAYSVLPPLVNLVLVGRPSTVAAVAVSEQIDTSALASVIRSGLAVLLAAYCAYLVVQSVYSKRQIMLVAVLPLISLWAAVAISGQIHGADLSPATFALPLVALAVASTSPKVRQLAHLGRVGICLAALSLLLALFEPDLAIQQSNKPIWTPFQGLLAGPLGHANTLGQALALTLPLIFLVDQGIWRWAGGSAVLVTLMLTGSRTCLIAVAGGLAGAAIVAALARTPLASRRFAARMLVPIIFAGLIMQYIVIRGARPFEFSGRGQIWGPSLRDWRESPWLGNGPDYYRASARLVGELLSVAYHGHNEIIHLLATAGLAGIFAAAWMIWGLLWKSAGSALQSVHIAWGLCWLTVGFSEVPTDFYSLTTLSLFSWIPLAMLIRSQVADSSGVEAGFDRQAIVARRPANL